MYRKADRNQLVIEDFYMPFGGHLRTNNRWVKKARCIPWEFVEDIYAKSFKDESTDGRPPLSARIAFGALIIKESENLTDEGTVEYISENPYAQYFLGLHEFRMTPLFDASMMTRFRKRFSSEDISSINEAMYRQATLTKSDSKKEVAPSAESEDSNTEQDDQTTEACKPDTEPEQTPLDCKLNTEESETSSESKPMTKNQGTLVLDATAAPSDVRYPTDLSLINESRENIERMIDEIWDKTARKGHKTSYSRKKARKSYLSIAKQRKPRKSKVMKAIKEQLRYLDCALKSLDKLLVEVGEDVLPQKRIERISIVRDVLKQQIEHYQDPSKPISDRIINLRQPHVRPIVRGKAGVAVEFGQKLALSIVNGYAFIDEQSFNNFNEGITLIASAEKYRLRFGFYPEAILADTIYRNRENRSFCKKYGIRLSGPRLGRPKADELGADAKQAYVDSCNRNIVESRNGIAKRRYGLSRIMSILPDSALSEAAMNVFVMNIAHLVRALLRFLGFSPSCWILSVFYRLLVFQ